jgi:carboxypeptidase C (cathepsin A)
MKRFLLIAYIFSTHLTANPLYDTTIHSYQNANKRFEYSAYSGKMPIIQDEDKIAEIFFISYLKNLDTARPLTFYFSEDCFSPATYKSITSLGPKKIHTYNQTLTLQENPDTILDVTDLIFFDPIYSGYSKNIPPALCKENPFEKDLLTSVEFIHSFLNTFQKWNHPIYLLGHGGGCTKVLLLYEKLLEKNICVDGLLLINPTLDFDPSYLHIGTQLTDAFAIPTICATVQLLNPHFSQNNLEETVNFAKRFLFEEYLSYLLHPTKYDRFAKEHLINKLSNLTQISESSLMRLNARISKSVFIHELLEEENKIVYPYDTRIAIDNFNDCSVQDFKKLQDAKEINFFKQYLNQQLQFQLHAPYMYQTHLENTKPINWNRFSSTFFKILPRKNFKMLVATSYYDLIAPFALTQYCFELLELKEDLKAKISFKNYFSGNEIYQDVPASKKLVKDLKEFFTKDME